MTSITRIRRLIAALAVLAFFAASCGGGDDSDTDAGGDDAADTGDDSGGDDADDSSDGGDEPADDGGDEPADDGGDEPADDGGDEPEEIVLTDSWRGVTAETITVGISMLDFELLQDLGLSPNGWGDQQAVWQALIDEVNDNGGVNGRMIEAVYDAYSAIDGADAERSCAVLTEDNEVFAVLGGFVGPLAGTADPCVVGLNETILVGGEITESELAQANAPWFTPDPPVEAQTEALLNLLVETGRADGAKVFTIGGAAAADEEAGVIAELQERGIEVVGGAIIEAADGDTIAQDAELEVAFERFVAEGANTLMIFGTPSAMIRGHANAGLVGEIAVWTNDAAGLGSLGATITDKSIANGVLTSTGPTDVELWEDPAFQEQCVAPAAARIPDSDFRSPADYVEGEETWFNALRRYCKNLGLFVAIATAAGGDLTPESFEAAAYSAAFDDFSSPGIPAGSLSDDKRGAIDLVRLSEYDASVGDGDVVPVTELIDVYP